MYWEDLEHHHGGGGIDEIWLNHPLVSREANRQVSGDPGVWPSTWFAKEFSSELPLRSIAVVGCGTGALERGLLRDGVAEHVTALDLAAEPLRRASDLAGAEGLQARITYVQADANQYLASRPSAFDGVFFHASLHHFEPNGILRSVRDSLRPGGLLYLDEYVGPSRNEWNPIRLLIPNLAYRLLPRAVRRPHLIRAPINPGDETEACASHRIVPAVRELFDLITTRSYGGNLLALLYPNLHRPPDVAGEVFDRAIRRLMNLERHLLAFPGVRPWYVVMVARKRQP